MPQLLNTSLFTDPHLKAYWRMEGNSNDSSSNGHNGSDTSIVYAQVTPKFLQYASFNGSSSFISVPTSADFAPPAYTAVWWGMSPSNNWGGILGKDTNVGPARQFFIQIDPSSKKIAVEHNGGLNGLAASNNAVPSDGNWHQFAVVFTGGTIAKMYQDGTSIPFTVSAPFSVLVNQSNALTIGCRAFSSAEAFFSGLLDDIAWFDKGLTDSEIALLYQSGFSGAMI